MEQLEKNNPLNYPIKVKCSNNECKHEFYVTLSNGAIPVGENVKDMSGEFFYILCHYAICPICKKKIYLLSNSLPKRVLNFLEENSLKV